LSDSLAARLDAALVPDARKRFAELRRSVEEGGFPALEVRFPALVRCVGRGFPFPDGGIEGNAADLAWWRTCDLAAAVLLTGLGPDDAELRRLNSQGDAEERRMLLRSLPFLPSAPVIAELLQDAHRSNDGFLFAAGLLDSDLPARLLDDEAYDRVVLKVAFLDLPASRLLGIERRARPRLSAMLLDFMSEREAAGRPVWTDSLPVAALAPVPGVHARCLGDLWHGSDDRRSAAARALVLLGPEAARASFEERRPFERDPAVCAILDSGLAGR
jgi:hypothetical protein